MIPIRIRDLSFGTKILLYGSGASLFSLVLAMAAILLYDSTEFRNAFVDSISDRADILSRSSASALVFKDPASAARTLTDLDKQQDVMAACVYDETGAVFTQFEQVGMSYACPSVPPSPRYVFREGRLDVFRNIKFRDEVVGMLYIRADPYKLQIRLQRYLGISVAVLFVSFLAAVLLAVWLKRGLIRPIQELVAVAETVSKDSNYAVQARKFANDELGELADAFNQMIQRVQLREEERDDAEAELKHQLHLTKTITDNAASCLFMMDKQGCPTFMNPAAEEICGYTLDDIRGMPLYDSIQFLHPGGRSYPMSGCAIDNVQTELRGVKNYEDIFSRKDGSLFPVICYLEPLEHNGKHIGSVLEFRDVTEQKLAEEELRESEEKLKALFTSLTEMVVMNELVKNADGEAIDYRIIDCNQVFTDVTGIRKEDAVGNLASHVYKSDPPPYLEKYIDVALGGGSLEFTTFYPSSDKHFMMSVVSPQIGRFATIGTDVSAMMQVQDMIVAKNKEMESYLYIASHDLRTPLVNIQGFSQRLKKQADSIKTLLSDNTLEPNVRSQLGVITDEDIPKTLSFVLSNIEKMDALINGLLRLSRTGRVEMSIQKIDMNTLLSKILQSLDFQIKEVECDIHLGSLPDCYGDAELLDQLFTNLLSNALKYSDSERALDITVGAEKNYSRVVYSIRDTGRGIASNKLEKIWDVFYRVDPRSDKTGEGIGLSLVKRIAEKHKGRVWAESEEDKGSVFYIELHSNLFSEI